MADIAQLEAALVKADAAGDVDGARILAGEVRRLRGFQAIKADGRNANPMPAGLETATQVGTPRNYDQELRNSMQLDQVPYELGAKVNDAAAKVLPAPVAAGLGTLANVGLEGAAMMVGGGIGGATGVGVKSGMQDAARWTMQKALKPSTKDFLLGKGNRAIDTLLEEGVNVSPRGVEKLRGIGEGLNRKVAAELAASTATIPKSAPPSRIISAIHALEDANSLPSGPRAAMEGVYNEFMTNPLVANNIPLTKAQTYKQTLYKGLKDNYGKLSEGDEAARKALALGLKEELERGAPAIAPLNKRASDIWNALNVTERRAYVGGNNNPVSLPAAFTMVQNPAFGAGMIVNTSDKAKSLLARMLYTGGKAAPAAGTVTGAGLAALLREEPQ